MKRYEGCQRIAARVRGGSARTRCAVAPTLWRCGLAQRSLSEFRTTAQDSWLLNSICTISSLSTVLTHRAGYPDRGRAAGSIESKIAGRLRRGIGEEPMDRRHRPPRSSCDTRTNQATRRPGNRRREHDRPCPQRCGGRSERTRRLQRGLPQVPHSRLRLPVRGAAYLTDRSQHPSISKHGACQGIRPRRGGRTRTGTVPPARLRSDLGIGSDRAPRYRPHTRGLGHKRELFTKASQHHAEAADVRGGIDSAGSGPACNAQILSRIESPWARREKELLVTG